MYPTERSDPIYQKVAHFPKCHARLSRNLKTESYRQNCYLEPHIFYEDR